MSGPRDLALRGLYLGTASWTDPTLVESGRFYPSKDMTAEERLRFYAERFPLVEVDSTYYAPPSERLAGLWVTRTPADFVFDVKAFRLLTQHPTPPSSLWKDLRDEVPTELVTKRHLYVRDLPSELVDEAFARFASALTPLRSAGKLGVILFQLPPYLYPTRASFRYLAEVATRLEGFTVAVEFRNGRWLDEEHRDVTFEFLAEHRLVYVAVDEPQGFRSSVPPVVEVTNRGIAVVRFHGRNAETWEAKGISAAERFRYEYRPEELAEWVPRIRRLREDADRVHLVFNNCYADYGVRAALLFAELLAST